MDFGAEIVPWSDEAAAMLSKANAEPADLIEWRRQCARQQAQLWHITGASRGYLLTRVEQSAGQKRELVLVAGAGVNAKPVIRWAKQLAEAEGLDSIRTHIKRRGLMKMYLAEGWHNAETVMRVAINGR